MPDASLVVDPAILARVGDLDVLSRRIVDGVVSGLHASPFHGYSAEFHQYREYRHGDDLRYVDWKRFGRTDRLYSKQFRETTNLPALFVLDTSASMDFAGGASTTKLRYAVWIIAIMAHLLSRQGDQLGLLTGNASDGVYLRPRAGRTALRHLLVALARTTAGPPWSGGWAIRTTAQRMNRRGLLVVCSDFCDDEDESLHACRDAASMGHDVAVFHLLSPAERSLDVPDNVMLQDAERPRTRHVSAADRATYRARVDAFIDDVRSAALSSRVRYSLVMTDDAIADIIRRFLLHNRGGEAGR